MRASRDQVVTVEGVAADAKAGAVVLVENVPIYLEGLASWPEGWRGAEVRVTGMLREKKLIADPVDEKGAIAQGAAGAQLVIEAPRWERR